MRKSFSSGVLLAILAACGGKVVEVDGASSSSSGGSGSSSSGGALSTTCSRESVCADGRTLQFCSTLQGHICVGESYQLGATAFQCPSCNSDCSSARAKAYAACGLPTPVPPPPPPPPTVDASVPPACPPVDIGGFTPAWRPPAAHQNACSQQNIDNFRTFCLGTGTAQACQSFLATADGKTCAQCILTQPTAAALGPLIDHVSQGFVSLNVPGCVALVQGNDACARALSAEEQCDDAACVNCKVVDDQSLAALNECITLAQTSSCAAYAQAATCADPIIKSGQCPPDVQSGDFTTGYNQIVPLFCLTK